MAELSENHRRHVLVTFRYIDQVLDEAERIMASSRSAFPRYVADLTPVQGKLLMEYFARLREALLGWLAAFQIAPGGEVVSALHALRVQFTAAEIALEDLNPGSLRGYGAIAAEAVDGLLLAAGDLRRTLRRMATVLEETEDRDLKARLERLAATTGEARLLAELDRVITAHGIVELRPTLSMLVERIESRHFEVAVFGRVSSGKSSLLNHLLRHEVLPVGVTPITAVPTRVRFGSEERVVVAFAERSREILPLARLPEVATEQQNPGNRKHVTHILVEIQEPRLESGVTFVDTPGLGSLATSGAEETLAYLPRCDLGIVLVEGAASLGPQDVAVVRALYQAGAAATVLLSKADLLSVTQREDVVRYAEQVLLAECGAEVRVSPVSVVGSSATLADEWFARELLPLCREQEVAAALAIRRKVGALREAVIATLRLRLDRVAGALPVGQPARLGAAVEVLTRLAALPEDARAACEDAAMSLEAAAEPILGEVADQLAARWRTREEAESIAHEVVAAAVTRATATLAGALASRLSGLREELAAGLRAASDAAPGAGAPGEPPRVAGLPAPDLSALRGRVRLDGAAVAWLGPAVRRRWLAAKLRRQLLDEVREVLRFHRRRLVAWSRRAVADLQAAFEADAEAYRARLKPGGTSPTAGGGAADAPAVERDLELLTRWGQGEGEEARCRS